MSDQDTNVVEGEAPKVEISDSSAVASSDAVMRDDRSENKTEEKREQPTAEVAETSQAPKEDAKDERPSYARPPSNMLRVERPAWNSKRDNKFDPSVLGESSDPNEIRTQIHFYFSDSNLTTDKYMTELTGGAENKPVELSKICSFKRMRRFQPYPAVVAAMKESKFLVVEGEEGKETIKRQKAFDPEKKRETDAQTVYVKGFGPEEPDTQFKIEAFFSKYGTWNSVRLRRGDPDKGFKGSVFVEWVDKETAEKFMTLDPKPQWQDHDLLILWKSAYEDEKNQLIRDGKLKPSGSRGRGNFRGRGRGRSDIDSNDWKKRREEDQKNGFQDRRGGRGRGRGRGGGRGNFRGRDRGHGENRRDQDEKKGGSRNESVPKIQTTSETKPEKTEGSPEANGKRGRDEDANGNDAPPAKKVDTKETPVAEAA